MPIITYNGVPVRVGEAFPNVWADVPLRTVIITDGNVQLHWGHLFEGHPTIVLEAGEGQKSLAVVEDVIHRLIALGADRGSFLLGVGGGVVCDLTGFVASVFMRGIPFAYAPTTLLAQVDAAIGGKNGVNTGPFKNMIGVFKQPKLILSDPQFLTTLPDAEFSNGLAECIKHACISSEEYFGWLEANMGNILQRDSESLALLILESVYIKCAIVEADPLEKGERRMLNFGHTFGHAIEKALNIPHGQAVSLGMMLANELAVERGLLLPKQGLRVAELLSRAGLPTDITSIDRQALKSLIRGDKKKEDDRMAFILLKRIGEAVIEHIPLDD